MKIICEPAKDFFEAIKIAQAIENSKGSVINIDFVQEGFLIWAKVNFDDLASFENQLAKEIKLF